MSVRRSPAGIVDEPNSTIDGYRGIWFGLGQFSDYGDKYSGGLGTYTVSHSPMAVYAPKVDKTFFTYGGTARSDSDELLIMASFYDHGRNVVPRPTVVCRKTGVTDPHDNASIAVGPDGHIFLFVSGRGRIRPGLIYRSNEPYAVDGFTRVGVREMTYPQPTYVPGAGFINLFTKYTQGRELYWHRSGDGVRWTGDQQLAGFGGHYQVSAERDGRIVTVFDYHPGGDVDARTNLYALTSDDFGTIWSTVDGVPVATPLSSSVNPALVIDYQGDGRLNYLKDVQIDDDGRPVVLHVTSSDHRPGPRGPRIWCVTSWDGVRWIRREITTSDHNYDSGSLFLDGPTWTVFGPTQPGPQRWQAGGEMVIWRSTDHGGSWTSQQVTSHSSMNHTFARRPLRAKDPFYAFWADGDPTKRSPSRLLFGSSSGEYWQLPYTMDGGEAEPSACPA